MIENKFNELGLSNEVLKAIELFGTQVAPKIRAYFAMKEVI